MENITYLRQPRPPLSLDRDRGFLRFPPVFITSRGAAHLASQMLGVRVSAAEITQGLTVTRIARRKMVRRHDVVAKINGLQTIAAESRGAA